MAPFSAHPMRNGNAKRRDTEPPSPRTMPRMKRNLPTPVEVAAALRLVDADYDEWLAVQTPLTDRPFPILTGMFVDTASLSNEQFTELSDCYMYALRHGWASWERKHGKTPTR